MASAWTKLNLDAVEDAAPGNGFGERWEARAARQDLGSERTGLTYFRIHPGRRSPFVHRHREAEEVYVVLSGEGTVKLGDELRAVRALDAIRIAPEVPRAFEAGPGGLELLACGVHHEGDGERVDDDWVN
jgi:mannose-6-phosphate isomerase-like protein (cupin superfamily)